jgi:transcriptional regulator with XRE-family HTH domain
MDAVSAWREPGARARERRADLSITLDRMATELGVELDAYEAFEHGEPTLGSAELRALASVLGLTADELLLGDELAHVLLRANDDAETAAAVDAASRLIDEYLLVEALVGT